MYHNVQESGEEKAAKSSSALFIAFPKTVQLPWREVAIARLLAARANLQFFVNSTTRRSEAVTFIQRISKSIYHIWCYWDHRVMQEVIGCLISFYNCFSCCCQQQTAVGYMSLCGRVMYGTAKFCPTLYSVQFYTISPLWTWTTKLRFSSQRLRKWIDRHRAFDYGSSTC